MKSLTAEKRMKNTTRRITALLFATVLALFTCITAFAADGKISDTATFYIKGSLNDDYATEVLSQLNSLRASLGVGEVRMNSVLCDIAAQRAAETAVYFSHTRPDGRDCFSFAIPGCYAAGENIAIGHSSPTAVMEGWIKSKGHYLNMIDADYTDVGIACFKSTNGYLCWVQYFANCTSSPTEKSGVSEKTFKISATSKYVNLFPSNENYHFSGANADARFTFDIFNENIGFSYVRQAILSNTVLFSSSDETVAQHLEKDVFRVRGYGEAEVYASIGSLGTVSATVYVQKSGASDSDLMFVLNDKGDGYILSDCAENVKGAVTVPSYHNGLPVTAIGDMAFYGCKELTSVTLPESIVSIGRFAFFNCTALSSVSVPDKVTFIGMNSMGYSEENGIFTQNKSFTVICKSGSVAEKYATECGFNCILKDKTLFGDVNGDGMLTPSDVVLLRRYFANYDSVTGTSATTVFPGADANGDGEITPVDVVLLRRYFANYNSETDTSTVVLGPQ